MLRGFVYILPAVLFFSYYPIISLGADGTMNFELSLPLIWLVLFDMVAFGLIVLRKKLKEILRYYLWLLLPIYLTLSVIWSPNFVRGVLTVGILWLLYFAEFAIYTLRDLFDIQFRKKFLKIFLGSTVIICIWCVVQCILDIIGVSREYSLMCAGCTYRMFGFPHPNGFAIEPQFMGNLLLAPCVVAGWLYISKKRNYLFYFFGFVVTLFLTFSRGAIYAFMVALLFMTMYLWVREKKSIKKVIMIWGVTVAAFLFTLNMQGVMAEIGPTSDTYWSGVSKVLNHLSLGIIDVKKASAAEEEAVFDGYVAESTDTRVRLSRAAIQVWKKDFKTILFGVGIGGAGQALYVNDLSPSPKEITQNQYTSLLLEAGLTGILLFGLTLVLILKALIKSRVVMPILTLLVAYGITLVFFSGLPNALQIYLLSPILTILFNQSSLRKKLVS